ncbi:MAG: lysophospholipid acyltransferase family protein [Candidatus Neomarinimicrobiota bacterium]
MSKKKLSTQFWFEYLCLRLLVWVLTPLTIRSRQTFAEFVGTFAYFFLPFRKKVVLNNLKRAFPESTRQWRHRIARRAYVHFTKVYFDLIPVFHLSDSRFFRYVRNDDQSVLDDVLKQKKGALIVLFHLGNWEVFADWYARKGYAIGAIAKKLKNPLTHNLIFRTRTRNGARLFPKTKRQSVKMWKFVKNGNILYMVADQDAGKNGIFVRFFDQWSSTFRGPALFATKLKCPLILGTCLMDTDGKYAIRLKELQVEDAIQESGDPIQQVTQSITDYFQEEIRRCPEQYYWFHRRWKTKPPKELLGNNA